MFVQLKPLKTRVESMQLKTQAKNHKSWIILKQKKSRIGILYIIIVLERMISETIAARGLKFWLQVALGPPIAP